MDLNSTRNQMLIQLVCDKHPDVKLNMNHKKSRIGANSAYQINPKISVEQCRMCRQEYETLVRSIQNLQGLSDIDVEKNND